MFETDKFLQSLRHDNPLRPRFTIKPAEFDTMLEIVHQGQQMEVPIAEILSFAARWEADQDERAALGPPRLRRCPYPLYNTKVTDPDVGDWGDGRVAPAAPSASRTMNRDEQTVPDTPSNAAIAGGLASHSVQTPRRLVWPDEDAPAGPPPDELRQIQTAFWAKVSPPFYDCRVVDYAATLELDWD